MAHWGTRQSPSLCALWIPCRRPLLYRQKSRPSVIQDIPREIPKEILRPFSPRADQHETPIHLQPRGDGNHSYQIHQMIKLLFIDSNHFLFPASMVPDLDVAQRTLRLHRCFFPFLYRGFYYVSVTAMFIV